MQLVLFLIRLDCVNLFVVVTEGESDNLLQLLLSRTHYVVNTWWFNVSRLVNEIMQLTDEFVIVRKV